MAYSKFLAVLLGSQLSFTVNSIDKSGHGSIRLHKNENEPLLRVVNKTRIINRTRPRFKKLTRKPNNNNHETIKTLNQVTALFSNTFYNIFNFREKGPEQHEKVVVFEKDEGKSSENDNLAQDYAAAYEDYISSFLGSDLESAVNGDGNSEYYYSDDYIDYEFDSISQIEDTTTKNKHATTNSNKIGPEKTRTQQQEHLDKYPVQPVVMFSIALTIFGILQIIINNSEKNNNNNSLTSCDDKEEDNFIIVNSEISSDENNFKIILKSTDKIRPQPSSLDKIDEEPLNV